MKNKVLLSCLALAGFSGCEYLEDLATGRDNRDYTTFQVRVVYNYMPDC